MANPANTGFQGGRPISARRVTPGLTRGPRVAGAESLKNNNLDSGSSPLLSGLELRKCLIPH